MDQPSSATPTGAASDRARQYDRVIADPEFRLLVRRRGALGTVVVITMIVIYFGYVTLLAFAPGLMHTPVSGVITAGFPLGLAVIVLTVALVGFYVWRASGELDRMQAAIVARSRR